MERIRSLRRKAKRTLLLLCAACAMAFCRAAAWVLPRCSARYRHLWLISERGIDARDNAYHYFRYLRERHPERNAVYVIDPNSPDAARVKQLGPTVDFRSFRHYLMIASAEYRISTHIMGYTPDSARYIRLDRLGLVGHKQVFLQHGIIKDDMAQLHYPNVKPDLFCCGSKKECVYIQSAYGHPAGVVRYLGLCRYDALSRPHETKRQVLLMPTWRRYIAETTPEREFRKTKYYERWQSLLQSEALSALLAAQGYEAVFYPHIQMQKYLGAFSSPSPRVRIASLGDADVQTLLMESAVLITDFSSVFFDFGYMEKPMLFYQFDAEEFRAKQYAEGDFTYEKDAFGEVVYEEDALLCALTALLTGACALEEPYLSRMRAHFEYRDARNCQRTDEAIRSLHA